MTIDPNFFASKTFKGQRDSTGDRLLAIHVADLIPRTHIVSLAKRDS